MAMTVLNNTAVRMSLGELNKNITQVGKQLAKISQGQRITGAADGASDYAISEKMRVRLRALHQDEVNVKAGMDILRVADGGIQVQMNLLSAVKEKVIDAANDSNSDVDRMTIQRSINQMYDEIEAIACETDYNGRKVLLGSIRETWATWGDPQDYSFYVPDSSIDIIPDVYDTLDGVEGPFDIFTEYGLSSTRFDTVGLKTFALDEGMHLSNSGNANVVNGKANQVTMDFTGKSPIPSAWNNYGFKVGEYTYILTTDLNARYPGDEPGGPDKIQKIYIGGCRSDSDIASNVARAINNVHDEILEQESNVGITASASGGKVVLNVEPDAAANINDINADINQIVGTYSAPGGSGQELVLTTTRRENIGAAGSGRQNLSGGAGPVAGDPGHQIIDPSDPDEAYVPATPGTPATRASGFWSTLSWTNSETGEASGGTGLFASAAGDTGITIYGKDGNKVCVKFTDTANGVSGPNTEFVAPAVYDDDGNCLGVSSASFVEIGRNFTGAHTFQAAGMTIRFSEDTRTSGDITYTNRTMTVTANDAGDRGNNYYVDENGYDETIVNVSTRTVPGPSVAGFDGAIENKEIGTYAEADIDFSQYSGLSDDASMKQLTDDIRGKSILVGNTYYEFMDTGTVGTPLESLYGDLSTPITDRSNNVHPVDLQQVRNLVQGGSTIGQAMTSVLESALRNNRDATVLSTENDRIGLKAKIMGTRGNNSTPSAWEPSLRSYEIDFGAWFRENGNTGIPMSLYGKGFRVYCATDSNQWFNFIFSSDPQLYTNERGETNVEGEDIMDVIIDVSQVTDAQSMVQAIYDQAMPKLTEAGGHNNHHMRVAADVENGILILYDKRRYNVNLPGFNYQERGAKIADGIWDNIDAGYETMVVEELVIHHTDHDSNNIHLRIPRTSLSEILGYYPGQHDPSYYNVLTKSMRNQLLGNNVQQGILDRGLEYLSFASTLVGAQLSRLESAATNIVTSAENTQASESAIRDADMAREMMEYVKSNMLAQSSQSMLAHSYESVTATLNLLR